MSFPEIDQQLTQNFKKSEFSCKCSCGFSDIDYNLVVKLQRVRDEIGIPLKITSGCRCPSHNESVGGENFSSHISGFAADISCTDSFKRMTLLPVLCREFRRVGVDGIFIHVDIDPTKTQDVLWTY